MIYAPGFYARTDELIELCKVASSYGGMYISHVRNEGNGLLEAIDELLQNLDSDQIADIALSGDTDLPPDVEEELMNAVLDCIDKLVQ